jgi:hypothetical protein
MEILHKGNHQSLLTIAKDRVTIKIGINDLEFETRIIDMSNKIVNHLSPVENTYRGSFKTDNTRFRITLSRFTVHKEYTREFVEGEI